MTEQEQIEKMAQCMCTINDENYNCRNCLVNSPCIYLQCARKTYNRGYRKASDVIDEFVKKIICTLNYDRDSELYGKTKIVLTLNKIASEMRQEVER